MVAGGFRSKYRKRKEKPYYQQTSYGFPTDTPDHLNPESLEKLQGKKILLPDHVGNRIRDDLVKASFDVSVLADGAWTQLSDNIRVYCITDYFQDAVLLIDIGGTLVVNLNDATDRGWGRRGQTNNSAGRPQLSS